MFRWKFLDTKNKSKAYNGKYNLSFMIFKGNQMDYSLNYKITSLEFCQNYNNLPWLKAWKTTTILAKNT